MRVQLLRYIHNIQQQPSICCATNALANEASDNVCMLDDTATGRVLSFEPQARMFQLLCTNVVINGLFQIQPKNMALSYKSDVLHMQVRANGWFGACWWKTKRQRYCWFSHGQLQATNSMRPLHAWSAMWKLAGHCNLEVNLHWQPGGHLMIEQVSYMVMLNHTWISCMRLPKLKGWVLHLAYDKAFPPNLQHNSSTYC